ncbi:Gfo/Idh/MocA family oxidoreductase [candidate division WOR-3 bacterium]|nr:Gfo/Idh/MocA family oxidoreductase [candidate division WOR-3 bacterium]
MIKCGVIGVGHMGTHHTRILAEMKEVKFVGISDIDERTGKKIAKTYKCKYFSNYTDLLKETKCVFVATPTNTHRDISIRAFDAGNHVFIEKPISFDLKEADEIIEKANKSKLVLQVGHIERFNPAIVAAKKIIKNPLFIEAHRLSPFYGRGIDVSVVLDIMVHDLDIILCTVESPLKNVSAGGVPVLTENVDIANARLEFENGAIANITASRISLIKVRKIRFWQKYSYVSVDCLNKRVNVFHRELKNGEPEINEEEIHISTEEPLFLQNKSFIDACLGKTPVQMKGEDARNALALAHIILEEIKNRAKKVNIDLSLNKNEQ